jgi:hypothetical protein
VLIGFPQGHVDLWLCRKQRAALLFGAQMWVAAADCCQMCDIAAAGDILTKTQAVTPVAFRHATLLLLLM